MSHNWKKNILVNLDLNAEFGERFEELNELIIMKGPYDAYYYTFQVPIRKRLDEFEPSEEELIKTIKNIKCFVLNYPGIVDFAPLAILKEIEYLSIAGSPYKITDLPIIDTVRFLKLRGDLRDITGISKWQGLEEVTLIYCYKLDELRDLKNCFKLKSVDVSYLGRTIDLSPLNKVSKIITPFEKRVILH